MSFATSAALQPIAFTDVHKPIPIPTRVVSVVRALAVALIRECPLLWSYALQGSRNPRADMEGPYYMIGAPDRQVDEGKAVMASVADLKKFAPYLMTVTVKTPKGDPVPFATVDWWQADTAGSYSATTYRFRGHFKTGADGVVEILTVAPGEYGPQGHKRAGHFHAIISPGETHSEYERLTTQMYVCPNNDSNGMNTDFLNYVRAPRTDNMNRSWSIAEANVGSEAYMGFPELDTLDVDTMERVRWWNERLMKDDLKVVAGAQTEIRLNAKGWSLF